MINRTNAHRITTLQLRWLFVALGVFLCLDGSRIFGAEAGTIKGTVRAVAAGATTQTTLIADARLTLINKATPDQPLKTSSNASGDFVFENLPTGVYTLTVEANGLTKTTQEIKLAPGALLILQIDLNATVNESVTIRNEEGLLSTSDVTTSNIVRGETLKNQPLRTDNFQNSISLTPGAIRDGFGNDYLKGARTGQSSYTVNGADVTDPATGNLAFDIPLEAASSVQIEENPYSASFGRFTGGVTNLQTKGGGDKFKVSAARILPTFHNIFTTKIDSFRPRVTFSGPIIKQRLYFLQSFEYRFSRIYVTSQPKPNNSSVLEGVNAFTQLDLNINRNNVLKFNAAFFPSKLRNFGLDTFSPVDATPNYKQRGMLFSISEQSVFKKASFLSSEISYKTFDVDVFAKSAQSFNVAPETNSGGYFADTRRRSTRIQWQETYYSQPLAFHGTHLLRTGFEFYRTSIGGQLRYNSIFIRRLDNTLAQRTDFTNAAPLNYKYTEAAAFAQDRWTVNSKLTLDYGMRFDRDGVTGHNNIAPRFSFLFQPLTNTRTIIRGGVGIFYDRSLSSSGYIDQGTDQVPNRIVTNYASDGATIVDGPRLFDIRLDSQLRTPRSVRWSIQLDHGLTKDLTARVGFMQRSTKNDLLIDLNIINANSGTHLFSSRGRAKYDEFQALLAYTDQKGGYWNAFYVYSSSHGDLNTADKFFSDTPSFAVRPNEYGRLPFDSPHRFMFYGQIDVSKKRKIQIGPIVEIRSGFPFSKVNERLDYVGARNGAGRFPVYFSLDLQVTKGFKLPS
ncbi:MAG: carboxypeptidase regulatory-like domain-containing protein, partial [Acidobacteriota bacterium]